MCEGQEYMETLCFLLSFAVNLKLLQKNKVYFFRWEYKLVQPLWRMVWRFLKKLKLGLLWWRSGWESACQCRGHGFEPWSGKIPHAAEQLSPCATATEPARLEPVLCKREAAIMRGPRTAMKSGPRLPQLEKALAQKRRPNTAIKIKEFL